ncbi:hypothetical protein [Rhodococcoides fascians]|uniref:hypothetical protein n=1 Tax=Rhodococcoides fascians TaxID=1828 RepID=UPI000564A0F0|nr:hypothetical protein [Rhodococcus fascians]
MTTATTDPKDQATLGPPTTDLAVAPLTGEIVEAEQLTKAEAEQLVVKMFTDLATFWDDLATAYNGRIWIALGLASWDDWLANYSIDRETRLPRGDEKRIVETFRQHGMTVREIAATTGMSKSAVGRLAVPNRDKKTPKTFTCPGCSKRMKYEKRVEVGSGSTAEIVCEDCVEDGDALDPWDTKPAPTPRTAIEQYVTLARRIAAAAEQLRVLSIENPDELFGRTDENLHLFADVDAANKQLRRAGDIIDAVTFGSGDFDANGDPIPFTD